MRDQLILPRLLGRPLARALRASPVVVLGGSRQTGKSTLARLGALGAGRLYRSLDDVDVLDRAQRAPEALVRDAGSMTLDEVQRAPELLLAVKQAVDEDRSPGRFLLTGSADLLLMRRVSETLAGRAVYLTLRPMTRLELLGRGAAGAWSELFRRGARDWPGLLRARRGPAADWRDVVRRGGYPTPAHHLRRPDERALWHAGYTQTYLERDLRDLSAIDSLPAFRRLMRAASLRIGNLVNQAELGRDVGMPQPTVSRHLDLLEVSYLLIRLPAFSVNRTSRLIKTPKLYWNDTALAMHLAGEDEPRGAHLESLVLGDLLAWAASLTNGPQVMFWRTASGREVDFVVEWKGDLLPIEVKATARPRTGDADGLRAFRKEHGDRSRAGLLLHTGDSVSWLAEDVLAAPWWTVM
ncbi:MAG TPA: ATP-binding protein [Vicinamibacteria bacterium]|nr:ATP-binding protein [Vicinamibacteria bacterium]